MKECKKKKRERQSYSPKNNLTNEFNCSTKYFVFVGYRTPDVFSSRTSLRDEKLPVS